MCCPTCRFSDCPGCTTDAEDLAVRRAEARQIFHGITCTAGDLRTQLEALVVCTICGEAHTAEADELAFRDALIDAALLVTMDAQNDDAAFGPRTPPSAPAAARPATVAA